MFENDCVAVWLLYIKKGYSTSMHCHPQKGDITYYLIWKCHEQHFLQRSYLKGGDAIIIEKGVFHATKSLSEEGIYLLEIENPPNKTDLIRLDDRYGRRLSGYEGVTEMEIQNLRDYDYFHFDETDTYEKYTHSRGDFSAVFEVFPNNHDFKNSLKFTVESFTPCVKGLAGR